MWLISLACADVDRDLPEPYRRLEFHCTAQLERGAAAGHDLPRSCALCHGERGDGRARVEKTRAPAARLPIRLARIHVGTTRVLRHSRRHYRDAASWPALSEQDAWNVTAYVLSLGEQR
jgi:mono/diheme cytochrome c family protein